jgi:hypothetical protein
MWNRRFKLAIACVLLLQMLHFPLPCPDLDGECLGIPIVSFSDANSWHVLVLGVRPCDDIDRGPFWTHESGEESPLSGSPYGDSGMVGLPVEIGSFAASVVSPLAVQSPTLRPHLDMPAINCGYLLGHSFDPLPLSRTRRAIACVWVI